MRINFVLALLWFGFPVFEASPEEWTINLPGNVPLVMVKISGGTFTMGSDAAEVGHKWDEAPARQVTVGNDFYLAKMELTQAQWIALAGSWPHAAPTAESGQGADYPAYNISWNDCKNLVTRLNEHVQSTAQGDPKFRLPSEGEWEYACRAGTQTRFFFGDSPSVDDDPSDALAGTLTGNRTDYMWFWANNEPPSPRAAKGTGVKLGNAWGLLDMSGNVCEWCEDNYIEDAYETSGSALPLQNQSQLRVIRGGAWFDYVTNCRSAARGYASQTGFASDIGMRVAYGDHLAAVEKWEGYSK